MEVSSALAEAQARLFALRSQQNIQYGETASAPPSTPLQGNSHRLTHAQWLDEIRGGGLLLKATEWFQALNKRVEEIETGDEEEHISIDVNVREVVVQPEIAMGMLRKEMAAAGRVWLLLRAMDVDGRGAVDVQVAREKLAKKEGGLGICGWRQLRNLLQNGDGTFWERRNGVIWLKSAAKVAIALDIERIGLLPVIVPVANLRGTIGDVRAALMATFHCGRHERPISRGTLREISGMSERSQANYETKSNVKAIPQFAVLSGDWEDIAWAHGCAAFQITDKNGRFGRPGGIVTVRQLPNCYAGSYRTASIGRRKRLHRQVTGLLTMGTAGNGCMSMQLVFATDARKGVKRGAGYFRDKEGWWCALA